MSFWIYGCWTRNSWRDANLETLRDNNPTDLSHVKTHWRLISRLQLTDHTQLFVSDKFPPEMCDTDIYTNTSEAKKLEIAFFSLLWGFIWRYLHVIFLFPPLRSRGEILKITHFHQQSSLPDTLSPLLVINYRSHCEHFALELFFAGEMASESRWHVLWIKRNMASVIKNK